MSMLVVHKIKSNLWKPPFDISIACFILAFSTSTISKWVEVFEAIA